VDRPLPRRDDRAARRRQALDAVRGVVLAAAGGSAPPLGSDGSRSRSWDSSSPGRHRSHRGVGELAPRAAPCVRWWGVGDADALEPELAEPLRGSGAPHETRQAGRALLATDPLDGLDRFACPVLALWGERQMVKLETDRVRALPRSAAPHDPGCGTSSSAAAGALPHGDRSSSPPLARPGASKGITSPPTSTSFASATAAEELDPPRDDLDRRAAACPPLPRARLQPAIDRDGRPAEVLRANSAWRPTRRQFTKSAPPSLPHGRRRGGSRHLSRPDLAEVDVGREIPDEVTMFMKAT